MIEMHAIYTETVLVAADGRMRASASAARLGKYANTESH